MQNLKDINTNAWVQRQKDKEKRYKFKNRYKLAYNQLLLHKPKNWLDIGTGNGYLASIVREMLNSTTVTGIDFVPEILAKAQNLNYRLAVNIDQGYLPFHDNSFDYITCMEVLEHLILPRQALTEIYRILKPTGGCLFSVPNLQFIEYVMAFAKGKVPGPAADPRHMSIYTINHLKNELSNTGFTVTYIDGCDASPGWLSKVSVKYLCKTILIGAEKI